jgi:hypothetical protein
MPYVVLSRATTSGCLVRSLAAMMANHSGIDLPYVASMLRIWVWSPSSTVGIGWSSYSGCRRAGSGQALFEQCPFGRVAGQAEGLFIAAPGLIGAADVTQ